MRNKVQLHCLHKINSKIHATLPDEQNLTHMRACRIRRIWQNRTLAILCLKLVLPIVVVFCVYSYTAQLSGGTGYKIKRDTLKLVSTFII